MLFDIGIGILLATLVGVLTQQPPTVNFILLGAGGAFAPDLDALVWLFRVRGRIDEWMHRHRDLLHYPLLFIPAIMLLGWIAAGLVIGLLLAVCAFAHFLHDTGSEGWGIRWFFPLDRRYFQLVRVTNRWELRKWTRQEQDTAVRQGGDPDWFKKAYGRGGGRLKRELAAFAAGAVVAAVWIAIG